VNRTFGRSLLALALLAAPLAAGARSALRPQTTRHGSYSESFTFIADLDDGAYVQLTLSLTNLGPGSLKGLCRAVVARPGGEPWVGSARFGKDEWSWRDGSDERLVVGPCFAESSDEGTVAEVPLDHGTVRLTFPGQPARLPLADAVVSVRDDRYRSEVLYYRVPVTATVALPGEAAHTLQGAGYLDHSRSTVSPRELAQRWIRFRALRGERGLLLLAREGRDGAFGPAFGCDGGARCDSYESFRTRRTGQGKRPAFTVDLAGGRSVEIDSGPLLYRDAPVEALGLLGRLVAPLVGSPVTYVYRARAHDGAAAPLEGILEVELSDE
jgi:hypothetical protein